ncbi:MAG: hypothetical protein ABIA78_02105 [archaeon]
MDCPYEHCIELMPSNDIEGMQATKEGMLVDLRKDPGFIFFDKKRIRELPTEEPELYKEIRISLDSQGISDEECWFRPDLNAYYDKYGDSVEKCRVFGYYCPGGEDQVNECDSKGLFD